MEEQSQNDNFTGFDNQPVARPARVAPSGGGGQSEKHRANREAAHDSHGKSVSGGSGIVDTSHPADHDGDAVSSALNLGKYGAHGGRKTGKTRPVTAPATQQHSPPKPVAPGQPHTVMLNSERAEELEKRMQAEAARATKNSQGPDAFDAAYQAIATTVSVRPQSAPMPKPTSPGKIEDDDFDF